MSDLLPIEKYRCGGSKPGGVLERQCLGCARHGKDAAQDVDVWYIAPPLQQDMECDQYVEL